MCCQHQATLYAAAKILVDAVAAQIATIATSLSIIIVIHSNRMSRWCIMITIMMVVVIIVMMTMTLIVGMIAGQNHHPESNY